MDDDQINLLPSDRQKRLAIEYRVRMGTVIALMVTALTIAAGLLLLPAYVFLSQSTIAKQGQLGSIESALAAADEKDLLLKLKSLEEDAAALRALKNAPSAAQTIQGILAVPHQRITLSGFSYTPAAGKAPRTLAVSGIAQTREALRNYQIALQGAPGVAAAELPVSAYAREANISFVISVTFAL